VTDVTSHCVFVFTTDGEHVTSIGQKWGELNFPYYVCVDNNGFIYVSEFFDGQIQCF